MSRLEPALRLAFVSVPGGSVFMEEILSAVADAVSATGTACVTHRGLISDIAEPGTRFVVVPHEYFALAPEEPDELYRRTIGFGVEHPGTQTFRTSVEAGRKLGARFELSEEAVHQLAAAGLHADHFPFGYVDRWDKWRQAERERPIDIVYLGTADDRRLALLAQIADDLDGLTCEFLIPPHEPMTRSRPDFLLADEKWELLASSKVLINLHREDKVGFEWIRGIEAMVNGCVVVTEPSTDLGPLAPGRHLFVGASSRIGLIARAVATDEAMRSGIARRAYELCSSLLAMASAARRLAGVASQLDASAPVTPTGSRPVWSVKADEGDGPMAVWIPEVRTVPQPVIPLPDWAASDVVELARVRSSRSTVTRGGDDRGATPAVDVICVSLPGDGPLGATLDSLRESHDLTSVHVATFGGDPGIAGWMAGAVGPTADAGGLSSYIEGDLPVGRGVARNLLLQSSRADLVCVIDAGDVVRPGTLRRLVEMMGDDPGVDVAFAMATYGPNRMVNVLTPEQRRLAGRFYLTRGFVARRSLLERIGWFSDDPLVEGFVDHVFWRSALDAGAAVRLGRWIGFALWPESPDHLPAEASPDLARLAVFG